MRKQEKTNKTKKAFVFDFDDTLATTSCKVRVINKDKKTVSEKLTPSEFNTHKIDNNHEYDFSEFKNPEFIKNANATDLISLAKKVHEENHHVYILTARTNSMTEAIIEFLLKHNIEAIEIFGVGSEDKKVNIAEEKRKILEEITGEFRKVYFYDDCKENCDLAKKTGENIKVYLV